MIIVYDFDGTLTPFSLPQYPILKQCGYTDIKLLERIQREMKNGGGTDFYVAFYKCYIDILKENKVVLSRNNICYGAGNTQFNNGVIDYFRKFQSSKTNIKHYIVTSGIKDYVDKTPISQFIDGIYGVTFNYENGLFQSVDFILSDKKKVDIIKQIIQDNNNENQIVFLGDGLTDKFAFEYVHSIRGSNIFIESNEHSKSNFQKLNTNGIINKCFEADFGEKSQINNYIEALIQYRNYERKFD